MLYLIIAYEYEGIGEGASRKLYGVFTELSLAEEAVAQHRFKSSTKLEIEPVCENYISTESII
jgi:hypothetical protein